MLPKIVSDAEGKFTIRGVPENCAGDHPWTHVFNTNSRGYFQYYMHTIRDAEKVGDKNGDIMLPKGTIVRGRVTASDTGQPIVSRHGEEDLKADGLKNAGPVYYYPIVTPEHPVEARKETPMGICYDDPSWDVRNLYNSATIHDDGTYAINVPPGPGVLFFVANQHDHGVLWVVKLGQRKAKSTSIIRT